MKLGKLICLLLVFFILAGMFSGCYDRREVDDLAYIIAIGLDKGKTNKLKLTLQFAVPRAIGGGGEGGGGGGGPEATSVITLECPTIYAGFNMANNFVSRQINLSHAKVIVFSKELASQGIGELVTALPRGREFRPTINVVVSRGEAEDYIKSVKPELETNPAKYYELNQSAFRYTAFTGNTIFHNFYTHSKSLFIQPVATLAGVSKYKSTEDFDLDDSTYKSKGRETPLEGDFKAGNLPKTGSIRSEVMGLAVFNGGKMVGELDGEETTYHLMVNGEYNHAYITERDPLEKDKFTILDVKRSRAPQHKVKIVDGKPQIDVEVKLEADIVVIQSGINYESVKKAGILEKSYEDNLKSGIMRYLTKTSKEFNTDLAGFGQQMKSKFLTWEQWEKFDWLNRYKDSTFNVEVDLKIRRPGLSIRTSPITQVED